jgi:segregation and condensation protein B
MEKNELKAAIEALIFAADHPISIGKLAGVLGMGGMGSKAETSETEGEEDGAGAPAVETADASNSESTASPESIGAAEPAEPAEAATSGRPLIKEAVEELIKEYAERGGALVIERVAGGFQMRTRVEHAPWIKKLYKIGVRKISRPAMESLAIVAYKQPITRGELESIRGVDSGGVLGTLMEKRLIKIVGRKEAPGRPPVYGTTKEFLETFDLKNLSHLPGLKDIEILNEEMENADVTFEATEDTLAGGDNVEAQGRGDDARGEGEGQRPDGDGTGDEG